MERELMEMHDPVFRPGSTRIADASIKVTPTEVDCSVVLFLSKDGGVTKAASSGLQYFTSTGEPQSVEFTIVMPEGGYAYKPFLDIFAVGDPVPIKGYQGVEDVLIPLVGSLEIIWR